MRRSILLAVLLLSPLHAQQAPSSIPALLIRGGTVYDGTGQPGRRADVRTRGDLIVEIGASLPVGAGERMVDASGLAVAPGFIDVHNHSDDALGAETGAAPLLRQGITTVLVGQDGSSDLPVASFMDRIDALHPAVNLATSVGHGTVRQVVLGADYKRPATETEIAVMKALVERGMRDGALGLSSGLEYDPGFYATTDELVALAEVAARFGGFYSSHVRDEENEFLKAWSEAIDIGKRAHIPVEISHMKAASRPVWGQAAAGLALVDAAVRDGVSVVGDWYPYTYWHSSIYVLIPDRDVENRQKWQLGLDEIGGASHVLIASFKPDPSLVGKTLDQIAQARRVDPAQLVIDLVHEAGPDFGVIVTAMIEDDLRAILKHPRTIICSDGSITGRHPRGYGAFPRVLGRYVRDEHVLPLEEALAKMTSRSARQIGLHDRGELAVGKKADIVIFDPATIGDRGTPEDPSRAPVGVEHVVVNGELVLNGGQVTAARPGRALRRQDAPRPTAGSTSHGTNGS